MFGAFFFGQLFGSGRVGAAGWSLMDRDPIGRGRVYILFSRPGAADRAQKKGADWLPLSPFIVI